MTGEALFALLSSRRSVRDFTRAPIERAVLDRVVRAGLTAPSATNRQPWQFTVVTSRGVRVRIVDAVRTATEQLDRAIRPGPHAPEWGRYGDFFWQPLEAAAAIVLPAVREPPDAIAGFVRSAGADPTAFELPSAMHPERCALGAAVMALLLQAHAEGLGAIWMAGPMVARTAVEAIAGIERPWQLAGAIALGHPARVPESPSKKSADTAVRWIEEEKS